MGCVLVGRLSQLTDVGSHAVVKKPLYSQCVAATSAAMCSSIAPKNSRQYLPAMYPDGYLTSSGPIMARTEDILRTLKEKWLQAGACNAVAAGFCELPRKTRKVWGTSYSRVF